MSQGPPSILVSDISVTLGGATLLEALTCAFPGEGITGLVGQNGSGKSTLLRVLARQMKPTTGSVTFAGEPIDALSDRAFAREIAYLPQSAPHAPGMTVGELVALGRYPWHGALSRFGAEDAKHVADALARTGTAPFSERLVDGLSGGERQRCWLAMLLAQQARLLLLDEPISALDVAHQVQVLELVREVCRERGVAAILVIHDMNLAARFCDHIVALKRGRLAGEGSPTDLMTPGRLEAIFDVAMDVMTHPRTGRPFCFVQDRVGG